MKLITQCFLHSELKIGSTYFYALIWWCNQNVVIEEERETLSLLNGWYEIRCRRAHTTYMYMSRLWLVRKWLIRMKLVEWSIQWHLTWLFRTYEENVDRSHLLSSWKCLFLFLFSHSFRVFPSAFSGHFSDHILCLFSFCFS